MRVVRTGWSPTIGDEDQAVVAINNGRHRAAKWSPTDGASRGPMRSYAWALTHIRPAFRSTIRAPSRHTGGTHGRVWACALRQSRRAARRDRGESGHIQRDRDLACDPGRRSRGSYCSGCHRAELVWSR